MSTARAQDKANPPSPEEWKYDIDFILKNPIQTTCVGYKRKEPINALRLENVRCFWCGGKLAPSNLKAYRERLSTLWRYVAGGPVLQMSLFDGAFR
jgi:hypothetical protein